MSTQEEQEHKEEVEGDQQEGEIEATELKATEEVKAEVKPEVVKAPEIIQDSGGLKIGEVNPTTRPTYQSMGLKPIPKEKKSFYEQGATNPTAPPASY